MSEKFKSRKLKILADRLAREASASRPLFSEELDERIRAGISRCSNSDRLHSAAQTGLKEQQPRRPSNRWLPSDRTQPGWSLGFGWSSGVAAALCLAGAVTIAWVASSDRRNDTPNTASATMPAGAARPAQGINQEDRIGHAQKGMQKQGEAVRKQPSNSGQLADMTQSAQQLAAAPDWALTEINQWAASSMVTRPWKDLDHDARLVSQLVIAPWPWYQSE
jgi:hypothetical protein